MLAFLIMSILAGGLAGMTAAVLGHGIWTAALWYVLGCWAGFLLSVVATLALRLRTRPQPFPAGYASERTTPHRTPAG
ncbi:hypothetical protein ACFMPD_12915 [Sedimentitalea sp. HM32M-2]|uniref:hypothetical protein n=1 Tax=Sedimentitalea sp. HM32M-2 TaxID=3351566 RepID=UPI00362AEA8B